MKRVKKFGSSAFKPKMPMAAPRMKKFAEGGKVPPMPKRKLRPEEDPNYNPMDDLAPPGNLPLPVRAEKNPPPPPPPRPASRPSARPPVKDKQQMEKERQNRMMPMKKYAKGGSVRGGGCETKGKTRGRFV